MGAGKEDHKDSKQELTPAKRLKLIQLALGIYVFFIQYGKVQERIFKFRSPSGGKFDAVWFLQLFDALGNIAVGAVGRALAGTTPGGLPQQLLVVSGVGQVFSKYCFSASLASGLSFYIATLAKSAKMVPVMVGSLLLGSQSFSTRQISQAAAIVGGTSMVTLAEGSGKSGGSSMTGLLYVAAALGCDGIIGGCQKKLKNQCKKEGKKEQPYDLMFWTNLYMAAAAIVFAQLKGEIKRGWSFCRANPAILRDVVQFAACGALGQACVFSAIANFDSVVATAVTTTRKLASVLLSLYESGGQLPPMGWAGLTLASAGIMGEVL